jgi:GNAT superfamily N-acetyltransferase/uncharacterized glyoxalase superfamily protein PhnB
MRPQVQSVTPILPVSDIPSTLKYYKDVLGASDCWDWESPPTHAGCVIGLANIQFTLNPDLSQRLKGFSMFLPCTKVDELYAFHQASGAKIIFELGAKPWGVKEYCVEDCNGAQLRFAQSGFLSDRKELIRGISIVRRPLTTDEIDGLMMAVHWTTSRDEAHLLKVVEEPICTVIAEADERAVGTAAILGHPTGNYLISNVIVHPNFQSQGVGKLLMAELDRWFDENGIPGALVKLFTGLDRQHFYSQFGYRGPELGLIGMSKKLPSRSTE